ncbi:D-alanyl-D-alanine carboxypeptidase/D-alanyl-D-alanine-endopeptidase [Bacteroidales bacterium OttesenSCG-928-J19]|nr:D-alanyl-D-alanine carboxypeptidase/D-alanyl-D-alanine-endopeptidase [Bacteroidales bacterium OttesenSCG-928-J19]
MSAQSASHALSQFVNKENQKHAGIGFKMVELETGQVIASFNEHQSLTPASTLKILTTATALELLKNEYRYRTELLYTGYIENGTLIGDILIVGSGDPTLGSEYIATDPHLFLNTFCKEIQALGIKEIAGEIIALDDLFGYEGIPPKWLWEDLGNAYAPGIYGLSIYDNTCKIELSSGAAGTDTQIIGMKPDIPGLQLTNEIKANVSSADNSYVAGIPFSYARHLYGTIPQNRRSFVAKSDIPDPGLLLAQELKKRLNGQGIPSGEATTCRVKPITATEKIYITHVVSPSLSEIVRVINVRSNNHYAEHLYRLLTQVRSVDMKQFWQKRGLDSSSLFVYDGSGISPANAVSAGFLTDLLVYMDKQSGQSEAFRRSLPKAGQEGSVINLLRNTSLQGKVRVKSGSISNVQCYAGYIEMGEKRYAMAILVNNYTGKRAEIRKDIEQLLLRIFNLA